MGCIGTKRPEAVESTADGVICIGIGANCPAAIEFDSIGCGWVEVEIFGAIFCCDWIEIFGAKGPAAELTGNDVDVDCVDIGIGTRTNRMTGVEFSI